MPYSNRIRAILVVAVLWTGGRTALGIAIPIVNPGFESQIVAPGQAVFPATGWAFGPQDGGVNRPPTSFTDIHNLTVFFGAAPEGLTVGVTNGISLGDSPVDVLDQQLASVLTANTTYTLQVDVGRVSRTEVSGFHVTAFESLSYKVALLAGNSVLAQDNNSLSLALGAYGVSCVTYTALAGDPLIGQNLRIQLAGGSYAAFDDVQLTAVAVPEPSSFILAAFGLIGLAAWGWRRKRCAQSLCNPVGENVHRDIEHAHIEGNRFMNHLVASAFLLCASFGFAPRTAWAAPIVISTVPVGDPGNHPDQNYGGLGQHGAVAQGYRIGMTEVTNAQYATFLNAKAASDPLALYNTLMDSNARGGITRSGADGSYSYAVKTDMGNTPVNFVSWYDAVRFTNWVNNGQASGDTEAGAYTLLGGTPTPSNGATIARNPGATWFLPTLDEWYKAAYYQPAAQGGDGDDYWLYPTRSNSAPTIATADVSGNIANPGVNVANYSDGADWNGQDGNVTSVGSAGVLSNSFYGTADQGGNVAEWTEQFFGSDQSGPARGIRGGYYATPETSMRASDHSSDYAFIGNDVYGFRIATIPEPGSFRLAAIVGLVGLTGWCWRRTR